MLHDLGIPFCAIVDKDFFTTYKNGKLDESRGSDTFLPEYSGVISSNKVIQFLFDSPEKIAALQHSIGQSYTHFFDFSKNYGLLPMQYCLEMDLIACKKSRELYFDHYGLEGQQRTYKHLLIDRKQAIKDPTVLLPIVKSMEPKDYPISYKKIRRYLSDQIAGL